MNARLLQILAPAPSTRATYGACVVVACFAHGILASLLPDPPPVELPIPVTEVELEPPKPAVVPKPPPPPPDSPPTAAAVPAKLRVHRVEPPSAAKAGALLTAAATPDAKDPEPVRFVSDPNGRGYGTGIVARGGTAAHAESSQVRQEPPPRAATGLWITPADQLKRQPVLLGDGCRGFFPDQATPDQGQVSIIATVQPSGAIARLEIESETPSGEGFASAARTCLSKRRFLPALDENGNPTATKTRINLRFTR